MGSLLRSVLLGTFALSFPDYSFGGEVTMDQLMRPPEKEHPLFAAADVGAQIYAFLHPSPRKTYAQYREWLSEENRKSAEECRRIEGSSTACVGELPSQAGFKVWQEEEDQKYKQDLLGDKIKKICVEVKWSALEESQKRAMEKFCNRKPTPPFRALLDSRKASALGEENLPQIHKDIIRAIEHLMLEPQEAESPEGESTREAAPRGSASH